jgi:serine protease AprX
VAATTFRHNPARHFDKWANIPPSETYALRDAYADGTGCRLHVHSTQHAGIDWTHPCLGGYVEVPNEKVLHAVSYTGEHPIDNFGHGTHVATIIAGDRTYKGTPRGEAQLAGMAPKAKLMGYKVLTAAGSGSATGIILAIEDAVRRGAHILNLSLGDSEGDPNSPECVSANNAMLAGVLVCVAAGNSGPEASSIGAPGAAHHVITATWS